MGSKGYGTVIGIVLIGAIIRFHGLGQHIRFHPDEALFVTFARQAAVQGDWLLHGTLDKPPLSIYLNALGLTAFGVTALPNGVLTLDVYRGELAARVMGVFASLLVISGVYGLARQLYRRDYRVALAAALLMAVSPLAAAFGATAFTDGWMLVCVVLVVWMSSRRQWLWAGIWMAAGIWCKQQAALYIPLAAGIGWMVTRGTQGGLRWRDGAALGLPIMIGFVLLALWDSARGQSTSLWTLAAVNNDPERLSRVDELLPRLAAWWQYGQYMMGSAVGTLAAVVIGGAGWLLGGRQRRLWPVDGLLAAYIVVYMLAHWLVAVNIYDRYLLLVLPAVVILMGRSVTAFAEWLKVHHVPRAYGLCLAALLVMALPAAWQAVEGRLPIGGDRGRHNGIEALANYLNEQRLGAIVYDHWLGWELGYYMGTWSDKRRVYYPNPEALVRDAVLQPDRAPRYWVVPVWANTEAWLQALTAAGFRPRITYADGSFRAYELTPP